MVSSTKLYVALTICLIAQTYGANEPAKSLSEATADFSLALLKNSGPSNENVFFSPWSISTCLGMLYTGSAGETKNQINQVVYHGLPESKVYSDIKGSLDETSNLPPSYTLNVANRVYTSNDTHLSTVATLKLTQNFKSDFVIVNFGDSEPTRQTINNWVKEKTRDKIEELIPEDSIGANTKMVLVNAIYFKGDWWVTFSKNQTRDSPFSSTANKKFNIAMMHTQHNNFHFFEDHDAQVLGIPFKNETLMMYFVLPTMSFGLDELTQKLNGKKLLQLFNQAVRVDEVEARIPKFKLKKEFPLKDVLIKLNATDMFDGSKADFSAYFSAGSTRPNLYVSDAFHQAAVEVNEEGSEAAAATAVVLSGRAARSNPFFSADQPFLYAIVHRASKNILFFGRFYDNKYPKSKATEIEQGNVKRKSSGALMALLQNTKITVVFSVSGYFNNAMLTSCK